jgi:hypothetical protein
MYVFDYEGIKVRVKNRFWSMKDKKSTSEKKRFY